MPRKSHSLSGLLTFAVSHSLAYQPIGRWGHHTALTTDGLFVYGGKTDQYNSYSYTSAPNSNDLLFLPLGNPFDAASPPWQLLNPSSSGQGQSGPAVSWHTLSTINDTCLMLLGGQPDPNSATVLFDLPDSSHLLNLAEVNHPYWILEAQSWANEPTRRIRHTSVVTDSSLAIIVGGQKADGSGNACPDNYVFDANNPEFVALENATGPISIFDHGSVMLSDGRVLVFGGYSEPQSSLVPFSTIWSLDTRTASPTWSLIQVSNASLPSPRRGFAATLLFNNKVLIHGGADAVLQQNFADGWVLDPSSNPMSWKEVDTLSQLGPRRDHFVVSSDHQVLFGFGYGNSAPASPSLYIYDVVNDTFVPTYTPSTSSTASSSTSPTATGVSQAASTHSGPSRTGSTSVGSKATNGSLPSSPASEANRATKAALAITFSILGAAIVIFFLYYWRRRHRRRDAGGNHFFSLADDDADSGRSHPIPVVSMIDGEVYPEQRSRFSIFHSFHLIGAPTNALRPGPEKNVARRRDMLADEDAYDREWYHLRRTRDAERSSWSFRSFVSNHLRGHEPSATNESIGSHRQGVSDPFADDNSAYAGTGLPVTRALPQFHQERPSESSPLTCATDPFADPVKHEDEAGGGLGMTSEPPSQCNSPSPNILGVIPDQASRPTLTPNNPVSTTEADSVSTPANSMESPSIPAYATSLINANRGPYQPISRADSWWKRFTRNSFLDRKSSYTSRKSPSMEFKEFGDPLLSIEEQEDLPVLKAVVRRSVEIVNSEVNPRSPLDFYEGANHGKSLSSFQTADTEAMERIGRMTDVIQRIRTSSYHSLSGSAEAASFAGGPPTHRTNLDELEREELIPLPPQSQSLATSHTELDAEPPGDAGTDSLVSPFTTGRSPSGLVAYERRLSIDNEGSRKGPKDENGIKVNYGLAPRQSLFVANPDVS